VARASYIKTLDARPDDGLVATNDLLDLGGSPADIAPRPGPVPTGC
jgi:hypothetical protein